MLYVYVCVFICKLRKYKLRWKKNEKYFNCAMCNLISIKIIFISYIHKTSILAQFYIVYPYVLIDRLLYNKWNKVIWCEIL